MSIRLMSHVWDTRLKLSSPQKFVLLALADFANDDGESCYPSFGKIAFRCSLTKRTVIRVVQDLNEMDILHKHPQMRSDGSMTSNKYFLNINALANGTHDGSDSDALAGDSGSPWWCKSDTRGVIEDHSIYPSYDPPTDPKKNIIKKEKNTVVQKANDKMKDDAKEVIRFCREITGINYKENTKAHLKIIMARMKEGASLQECKMVVARKAREWLNNPIMSPYVRISTLFTESHFPEYLAKCVPDDELKKRRKQL